jgi:hypothetical protein
MASLTLSCPYYQNKRVISAVEMLELYFYGISLTDQDGKVISTQMMEFYLDAATEEIEKELQIKIMPTIVMENSDFVYDDYRSWGYTRWTYPVKEAYALVGFIGDVEQITYPAEWISIKRSNDHIQFRNTFLVPTNGTATTNSIVYSGVSPSIGFFGNRSVPNYWTLTYCTGFDKAPKDILNFIGKMASINLFHILGDIILGAGIASQSIGIDGLSQSISTTSSATNAGYGARVSGYIADNKAALPKLKAVYKGFEMTSL